MSEITESGDSGDSADSTVWEKSDLHAGRCGFSDIGKLKRKPDPEPLPPEPVEPAEPTDPLPDMSAMTDAEIAQTAVRLLREATIEVFHKLGAGDWLYDLARTDPKNFLKMLQRLLPQSIEQSVEIRAFDVPASIRNLSIEELKAMRVPVGNVIDVAFAEVKKK